MDSTNILQDLLLQSPPGQFQYSSSDIRKYLTGSPNFSLLTDDLLTSSAREYNLLNSSLVDIGPSKQPLILSGESQIGLSCFLSSTLKEAYVVNEVTGAIEGPAEYIEDTFIDEYMKTLKEYFVRESCNYITKRFRRRAGSIVRVHDTTLSLTIVGDNIKTSSFFAGQWVGSYTISVNYATNTIMTSGSVRIHSHYYENGNIQLKLNKEMKSFSVPKSGITATLDILDRIGKFEDELLSGLQQMFSSTNMDTIKVFRRQMPRIGKSFQWNLSSQQLMQGLRGR